MTVYPLDGGLCERCLQMTSIGDPDPRTYMSVLQDLWGVEFCSEACAHAWAANLGWERPPIQFVTSQIPGRSATRIAEILGICMINPVSSACCELGTKSCVVHHRVA